MYLQYLAKKKEGTSPVLTPSLSHDIGSIILTYFPKGKI